LFARAFGETRPSDPERLALLRDPTPQHFHTASPVELLGETFQQRVLGLAFALAALDDYLRRSEDDVLTDRIANQGAQPFQKLLRRLG